MEIHYARSPRENSDLLVYTAQRFRYGAVNRQCYGLWLNWDDLVQARARVIGVAQALPDCVAERWRPAALIWNPEHQTAPVRWAREMGVLHKELPVDDERRREIEARMVKLDHLMEIYGSLGASARCARSKR
jgi:hypothetical protein